MHIDSIGLEEAVAEQDSAISELMSEALSAFERIRTGDMRPSGSKAAPKDGDYHGDPARPVTPRTTDISSESIDSDDSAGSDSVGTGDDTVDGQFEDLMKDIDFDEMAFAVPDGHADDDDASMRDDASDKTEYDTYLDDDDDDPMAQLRKTRPYATW